MNMDMMRAAVAAAVIFVAASAPAADLPPSPLVGTWHLDRQEINGVDSNSEPLTLKISRESGDRLGFAFSMPVNKIHFVGMSYAVRLDGSDADIKDSTGKAIGTVQMTQAGASQFKLVVKGPNRPDSAGRLTISPDGKSLISESDAMQGGRAIHSKQTFSRF